MRRALLAATSAAAVLLSPVSAHAAAMPRVTGISTAVEDHSYVTVRVHFSAPVPASTGRVTATGYAGRCVSGHCTHATFVLVPDNAARTVWIDTEVVNAPGSYVVTSVQLVPVAVGYPVKLAAAPTPFRITR